MQRFAPAPVSTLRASGCFPTALAAVVALLVGVPAAHAVPPAAGAVQTAALPEAQWVRHSVIPGERLVEIADRYGVSAADVGRWNHLKPGAVLSVGEHLRVWTRLDVPPRERILHTVERGESWAAIAKRYGVEPDRLRRRWNPGVASLRAGKEVAVWVERSGQADPDLTIDTRPEPALETREGPEPLPQVAVAATAISVGRPDRGRLVDGIQLPPNDALYTIRNPNHSWASSQAIVQLQRAIADFRTTSHFTRELLIADISRAGGGRFPPHHSHRQGRDVDIQLPLATGVTPGKVPWREDEVDWDVAWQLVEALLRTGEVRYIFLSRFRQKPLRDAAIRAGATPEELDRLFQYPRHARIGVIRHSHGHVKHIHVRFRCAPYETACIEL